MYGFSEDQQSLSQVFSMLCASFLIEFDVLYFHYCSFHNIVFSDLHCDFSLEPWIIENVLPVFQIAGNILIIYLILFSSLMPLRTYCIWIQLFGIYWDMHYCLPYGLSGWLFLMQLKTKYILQLLGVLVCKCQIH